ncbi:hypothetical Protein YC6258_05866 [Gynuella sunshinyii YC6258]|uniref:Uncharacterized protein n=1 Tax=Gynuella sunshinyii YC6258 TaxID=1445510 RepID=A0A0C5VX45_9GAMM|nr:hypothetical Protein YC6258_05866 [Gynuella sunshinyii YC6258]
MAALILLIAVLSTKCPLTSVNEMQRHDRLLMSHFGSSK